MRQEDDQEMERIRQELVGRDEQGNEWFFANGGVLFLKVKETGKTLRIGKVFVSEGKAYHFKPVVPESIYTYRRTNAWTIGRRLLEVLSKRDSTIVYRGENKVEHAIDAKTALEKGEVIHYERQEPMVAIPKQHWRTREFKEKKGHV